MSGLTRRENLQRRAQLLKETRQFFDERGFLEVETPLVSAEVIPELHIEPRDLAGGSYFLQASPELHMKRLLCEGFEAIYQVTRSFRGNESGRLHAPEFTIVEWYRVGDTMSEGIGLLDQFLQTVAGTAPAKRTSYQEAFQNEMELDPHTASCDLLAAKASEKQLAVPDDLKRDDRDEWLNLLLSFCIEPTLGLEVPEILYDYPQSQAALAKIERLETGVAVARRFELYWQGVELANGYDELTDLQELRDRLMLVNRKRQSEGRSALPLPESLFEAMSEPGLPPCSGCALGLDRLAMLLCSSDSIHSVRIE